MTIDTAASSLFLSLSLTLGACAAEDEFTGDDFDDAFGQDQKADGVSELVHYTGIFDERGYTHFGPNYGREYGDDHVVTVSHLDDERLGIDISPNVFPGVLFYGNAGENVDLLTESESAIDINVYRLRGVDDNNQFQWSRRLNSDNTNVSYPLSNTGIYLAVVINKAQDTDAFVYLKLRRHEVVPFNPDGARSIAAISMPNFSKEVWGSARREMASCGKSIIDMAASIKVPYRIVGVRCEEATPSVEGAQISDLFMGGMNTTLDVELLMPENSVVAVPTLRTINDRMDMHDLTNPRYDIEKFRGHCLDSVASLADELRTSNPIAGSCGHVSSVQVDVPERFYERVNHQTHVWLAPLN